VGDVAAVVAWHVLADAVAAAARHGFRSESVASAILRRLVVRIVCCGPRNLGPECLPVMRQALLAVLRASVPYEPGFVLAHGDARGGDLLWEEATLPTYWLAAHWNPEPDTPGTADMVRRLREANVPGKVVIVPRPAKEDS
jgi:hypothetical protein